MASIFLWLMLLPWLVSRLLWASSFQGAEENLSYLYRYKPGTDLLTAKFTCTPEWIQEREFLFYNDDDQLILQITDDGYSEEHDDLSGVSKRKIVQYDTESESGLPVAISESYWDFESQPEPQLHRIELVYSPAEEAMAEDEAGYAIERWDETDPNNLEQYTRPRIEISFSAAPSIHNFSQYPFSNVLIPSKGYLNEVEVDIVVACSYLHRLQFSAEEHLAGKFDLINHLHELIPFEGNQICLITAKNGILNDQIDHLEFCQSIVNKHPEGTLFLSLHNPSEGIKGDLKRLRQEAKQIETPAVALERQLMVALAEQLHQINPEAHWSNNVHSEGGLIARRAIEGMTPEQQELIKKHLHITALGPAKPIPKSIAFQVVNIYSEKDYITKWGGQKERDDPEYDIQMVNCISPRSERFFWFADHAFKGSTYQDALKGASDKLRTGYGFYAPQDD